MQMRYPVTLGPHKYRFIISLRYFYLSPPYIYFLISVNQLTNNYFIFRDKRFIVYEKMIQMRELVFYVCLINFL